MRQKLLVSAAALTIASPVWAADLYGPAYVPPISDPIYTPASLVVGHLELGIGVIDYGGGDCCNETFGLFMGAGRANVPLGGAWNLQIETGGAAWFDDGEGDSSIGVIGHLWTRLNNAAVGAFGGVTFPVYDTVEGNVGLEGEYYLGNVTLGANGSYNWGDGYDYWLAIASADIYLTPDFRLGGEASYDFGFESWNGILNGEYRFAGTPLTAWAEISYSDYGSGFGGHAWSGLGGIRVLMNTPPETTLQQHDRDVPWDQILGARIYLQ